MRGMSWQALNGPHGLCYVRRENVCGAPRTTHTCSIPGPLYTWKSIMAFPTPATSGGVTGV